MKHALFVASLLTATGMVWQGCGSSTSFLKRNVVAEVGSQKITLDEVDGAINADLVKLQTKTYDARKAGLDRMIDNELLREKAKSLGITRDELVKREIIDRSQPPNQGTANAKPGKDAKAAGLFGALGGLDKMLGTGPSRAARREQYLAELRKEAKPTIYLAPPRFAVDTSPGHAEGPNDAPITLIEFSDYQCTFCYRSQDTVQSLMERFKGKIRHVFMDFPLPTHKFAIQAAAASHCAEEQSKYEEYRKQLFEYSEELSAENLTQWAVELKLDPAQFEACRKSGKYYPRVLKSLEAGQNVGVRGTPAFFVNGLMIRGDQPYAFFVKTIEEELARIDSTSAATSR